MEDRTDNTNASKVDAPRSRRNKLWIWLGVLVFVAVVLVAGGLVWHQSPTFCNAFCHSPMDPYVEGYQSGDENLLVTAHADRLACLDCHEPDTQQQIKEASAWISGDFSEPLPMRKFADRTSCLKSGCHDEERLISATADWGGAKGYNPHDPRHGKQQCYSCHSIHRTSVLMCNQCHKLDLPKGWVSPQATGLIKR